MLATIAATGGSEEGWEAFDKFSPKAGVGIYDYDTTRERWDHVCRYPPDHIGAGTLVHLAREADPNWRKPSEVEGLFEVFDVPEAKYRFPLTRLKGVQLDTRRRYVVKGLIPRDGLIVVWAPPKCGKSF